MSVLCVLTEGYGIRRREEPKRKQGEERSEDTTGCRRNPEMRGEDGNDEM